MKQLIACKKSGVILLKEVEMPELQENGVLVRTLYSVISAGTERAVISRYREQEAENDRQSAANGLKIQEPQLLGYSSAGRVIAAGSRARQFKAGDLVACAGAGYANHAEYAYVPANLCTPLPEGVNPKHAAFSTLGAITLHGIREAEVRFGETAAVIGMGLIGLLAVQMLKAAGVYVIAIDIDEERVNLAKELGAEAACAADPEVVKAKVEEFTSGYGVDTVLIAASAKSNGPIEMAGEICRKRGRVVSIGSVRMDVPRTTYYDKEIRLSVSCSYGPGRYDPFYEEQGNDYPYAYVRWTEKRNLEHFNRLLRDQKINPEKMITHVFKFDENAPEAYDLVLGVRKEKNLGILFDYQAEGMKKRA